MTKTIKLKDALELMRTVSRVSADKMRERDGFGRWLHYPSIRRYQEDGHNIGKRGKAILVVEEDVRIWVDEQLRKALEQIRPLPILPESSIHTFEPIFPKLAGLGAYKSIKALSGKSRRSSQKGIPSDYNTVTG